jgi:TRAP transporter TAXI family solute receptor
MKAIKLFLISLSFVVTALLATTVFAQTRLTMSLGGTSGTFYVQGSALAEFLNRESDLIRVIPSTSGGSVENVRRVDRQQADLGIVYASDAFDAWEGRAGFEVPMQGFRIIGPAQEINGWFFFARTDKGITGPEDLAGKRFAAGAPGSGGAALAELFLNEAGLADSVNVLYMPWGEIPSMVTDNIVDAANRSGTHPHPMLQEIDATHPITVLDLGPTMDEIGFLDLYPYFEEVVIPAGSYRGQEADARTFGQNSWWVVREDLPEDVVYELTKLAYSEEAVNWLNAVYGGHAHDQENPLAGLLRPLHPGAARYWEEAGVNIPDVE